MTHPHVFWTIPGMAIPPLPWHRLIFSSRKCCLSKQVSHRQHSDSSLFYFSDGQIQSCNGWTHPSCNPGSAQGAHWHNKQLLSIALVMWALILIQHWTSPTTKGKKKMYLLSWETSQTAPVSFHYRGELWGQMAEVISIWPIDANSGWIINKVARDREKWQ